MFNAHRVTDNSVIVYIGTITKRWWLFTLLDNTIDKRIFNYLDAGLATLHRDKRHQKQSAPRWHRHQPLQTKTLELPQTNYRLIDLTTIINFQYCCIWRENVVWFLQTILIQYRKPASKMLY